VVAVVNPLVAGVREARVVSDEEVAAMLSPWLGPDAALDSLPVPELIDVVIDEVEGDLAAATVTSVAYVDLLQLARVDGAWRIVNVVWTVDEEALDAGPGSAAPQRPASGPSPDSRD